MDPAKIQQFAWTNDGFLNGPIRGVILEPVMHFFRTTGNF